MTAEHHRRQRHSRWACASGSRRRLRSFREAAGRAPGLAVVLVGEDPASAVYVRNKGKATVAAGMESFEHRLPADTTQDDLLALVDTLNADPAVDGILVQLPLPDHIDERVVTTRIDPDKDVDGFHPVNAGRLATGLYGFVPCTPLGCLMLLEGPARRLAGLDAVVIGRSNIVGKPMAQLLIRESCTVTVAHSRTRDLPSVVAPRRHRRRGGRPAGDGQGRVDQARRDRDRRRHQPHRERGWSATSISPARCRSRARSRRCRAGSGR